MQNTIDTNGKRLVVNGCRPIEFEEEIERVLDMESVVVVLTMPRNDYMTKNRIYGVKDGKVAWRVQDMLDYNPDYAPFMPNSYTYIKVYDKDPGVVLAGTFQGFTFLINPNNGQIIGTESWEK
ncbi:MAG: hypothetical protein RSD32_00625 [Oscillospiraceae bacterium]